MSFNDEPKNLRLSVHNKYKTRPKSLLHSVADFMNSELRLKKH